MTKTRLFALASLLSFSLGTSALAVAQEEERTPPQEAAPAQMVAAPEQAAQPAVFRPQGTVITPESSVVRAEDAGVRAHTNVFIFVPAAHQSSSGGPNYTFTGETPASLGCVYQVGPIYAGCNPATGGTNHPSGGFGAIVLVDAFDNPNAASDLAAFSSNYGLPAATFTKIYANSSWGTLNGMTASCATAGRPAIRDGVWRRTWTLSGRTPWLPTPRSF
jgi:hypothetical protein